MVAHYKVKLGLEVLEKSLTIASKRFSRLLITMRMLDCPVPIRVLPGAYSTYLLTIWMTLKAMMMVVTMTFLIILWLYIHLKGSPAHTGSG